ncbi:unnamed protein product [Paramecium pentaurelia]|uniref:Uncharacterized protein n=1 Tax=Paramecium pentaurelia TaxID=43138 RepID=A0A8S1UUC5_9CILI|nr:unnamed protein product [Paramecium pentaurelia]
MICSNIKILQNNENLTSKFLEEKIEVYGLEMQQCIESSFIRIDNFLDQIINDSFNSFNQNLEQSQLAMLHQQFILFPQLAIPNFANQQFGNELIHSLTPLVKFSIENEIKKNVEALNQDNRAIQKENQQIQDLNHQILIQSNNIKELYKQQQNENQLTQQKSKILVENEEVLQNQFLQQSKQIQYLNENLKLIENKLKTNLIIFNKELESSLRNYSKELAFSTKFKQKDIQILENGKIAFAQNNVWQVCICDQPIPKQNVITFKFNVLQMHQFYSGICFRDIISKDYRGYVSDLGHGYYLMCKDGYVYSNHDKEKNEQPLGFKLQVNDIIEITVDLKQQLIKWENKKSNQSYTLTIETNYELYPCFRLASSKVLLIE